MKKSCATTLFICFFILWCIGEFGNTEEEKVPLYKDIDAVVEKAGYIIQDNANDPDSYSFKDIYEGKKIEGGKEFIVEYRIMNVLGGMITKKALFYCNEDELIFIRDIN